MTRTSNLRKVQKKNVFNNFVFSLIFYFCKIFVQKKKFGNKRKKWPQLKNINFFKIY